MTGHFPIDGRVARGFERVREVFEANFTERGELGGAVALYHQGECVVDLWGGHVSPDRSEPWREDTLVLVFSTTKGMAALTMALAHSRGYFDLDTTVATYWPEFADNGKAEITVRQLLSHQAGLCALDHPLDATLLKDSAALAPILARQKPAWEPGSKQGYHYLSLGLYESELLRRTDSQTRGVAEFFRDEIADPLALDFHIGLPDSFDESRVAPMNGFGMFQMLLNMHTLPPTMVLSLMWPWSLTSKTLLNPSLSDPADWDKPEFRRAGVSSAGGIGSARAIACAYGTFATGGKALSLSPETFALLKTPFPPPPTGHHDIVMKLDMSFSMGLMKPFPAFPFGASDTAFGCPGAGGSFGYADPDLGIGFAYVTNKMGFHVFADPREVAVRDACVRCLEELG